jgi:hypothetical protein
VITSVAIFCAPCLSINMCLKMTLFAVRNQGARGLLGYEVLGYAAYLIVLEDRNGKPYTPRKNHTPKGMGFSKGPRDVLSGFSRPTASAPPMRVGRLF